MIERSESYIAVDMGAESGRIILGKVTGSKIKLYEIYRFVNGPLERDGHLQWDFEKLFSHITKGLKEAIKKTGSKINGIGIDSWGVDFGLLDSSGNLIENPYHLI